MSSTSSSSTSSVIRATSQDSVIVAFQKDAGGGWTTKYRQVPRKKTLSWNFMVYVTGGNSPVLIKKKTRDIQRDRRGPCPDWIITGKETRLFWVGSRQTIWDKSSGSPEENRSTNPSMPPPIPDPQPFFAMQQANVYTSPAHPQPGITTDGRPSGNSNGTATGHSVAAYHAGGNGHPRLPLGSLGIPPPGGFQGGILPPNNRRR